MESHYLYPVIRPSMCYPGSSGAGTGHACKSSGYWQALGSLVAGIQVKIAIPALALTACTWGAVGLFCLQHCEFRRAGHLGDIVTLVQVESSEVNAPAMGKVFTASTWPPQTHMTLSGVWILT